MGETTSSAAGRSQTTYADREAEPTTAQGTVGRHGRHLCKRLETPVGCLTLVASERGLAAILWESDDPRRVRLPPLTASPDDPVLVETARQLQAYFAGQRTHFDVPLDFVGTDFQRKVWAALLTIPFGETRSYAAIAAQIGHPTAMRAVGAANGRNPISIIAPCHRVIGASGKLTGFAGGLDVKEWLLRMERTAPGQSKAVFSDGRTRAQT